MPVVHPPHDVATAHAGTVAPRAVRRVVLAGVALSPRQASGLALLLDERLAPGARVALQPAGAAPDDPPFADPPDLLVIAADAADAHAWLAAARRHAPAARRMLLAGADDADSARLARRNGAVLVGTAGDGAPPLVDLAARCAELLAPAPAKPPARRRGPQPGSRTAEARRLAADLARAVACRELALHFQPTVDLRSGRVLGAEALARWPHPARGHIPPADFIPVAERSGLILDLGAWALADAVAEAARWGHRHLRVSVNVSPRQIEAGVLPAQVRRALDAGHLDPARLQIEITEGVLLETSTRTIQALAAVRAMGVGIALDDFGTGYASLAAVRRLPLTALKIDRSFVAGLGQDAEDSAIVRAMVEMAGALRLDIVAEGVENDRQRVALIGLGIREGQGWLFGRPAPPLALARHFGT